LPADNDYVRTIADYFLQKKGKGLILSPGDMALLLTWEAQNVPRNAVIRGIDRAFAALDRVLSLHGCRKFVEEEVNKLPRFVPHPTAEDEARERIEKTALMLHRAVQKHPDAATILNNAADRVEALEELLTAEAEVAIGEELGIIESGLADALLDIQSEDELSAVKRRIESSLSSTDFGSPQDRLDTIDETLRVWALLQYDVDFGLI
jgi:hypothetical protein